MPPTLCLHDQGCLEAPAQYTACALKRNCICCAPRMLMASTGVNMQPAWHEPHGHGDVAQVQRPRRAHAARRRQPAAPAQQRPGTRSQPAPACAFSCCLRMPQCAAERSCLSSSCWGIKLWHTCLLCWQQSLSLLTRRGFAAQAAPMQHAADDAILTDHVDEHRSDNWASYGAPFACPAPFSLTFRLVFSIKMLPAADNLT